MDLLNNINPVLTPGQRLLTAKGYESAEKYPMPRDCHAAIFDEDEDYVYIKRTDVNGGVSIDRYHLELDPIPKFDPKKYVTVDDFASFKEEILNGFNNLQQSIAAGNRYSKQGDNRGNSKQNNGGSEPSSNV